MILTPEQAVDRKHYLNASEIAAIFGNHPWINQGQLWAEKYLDVMPASAEDYMNAGNELEPSILANAERRLDVQLQTDDAKLRRHLPGTIFACTFDALVVGKPQCVEAKFWTGWQRKDATLYEQWGEPGTDSVPLYILLQCQLQMLVEQLEVAHVNCFVGNTGKFNLYEVPRSEALIENLIHTGNEWWTKHIVNGEQPPEVVPYSVTKRVAPTAGKRVELAYELVNRWREAKESQRHWAKTAEQLQEEIGAAMLDAEIGEFGDEEKVIRFERQVRKPYTVKGGISRPMRIVNRPKDTDEQATE